MDYHIARMDYWSSSGRTDWHLSYPGISRSGDQLAQEVLRWPGRRLPEEVQQK